MSYISQRSQGLIKKCSLPHKGSINKEDPDEMPQKGLHYLLKTKLYLQISNHLPIDRKEN